jgi:hypothetical protein
MPNVDDITWFKQQFQNRIDAAVQLTPFTTNMVVAVACQETGSIWPVLHKRQLSIEKILELCVGDTIDKTASGGRNAFPKTKAELIAKPRGQQMFDVARKALLDMSQHIPGYQKAAQNQNKFCHGFGIFQYDLQFFLKDPDYFLGQKYADFDACLAKCIGELQSAMKRIKWEDKTMLTELEMAAVAIAYNTGGFKPALGLKQGFKDSNGKFYGELFFDFLRQAKTIEVAADNIVSVSLPLNGNASLPPPTSVAATGKFFEVDVMTDPLRLRSEAKIDQKNTKGNVIASLPDMHIVRAVGSKEVNGFLEVETSLNGAHFRGFAAAKFLKPTATINEIPVDMPLAEAPKTGIVAVYMPRKQAGITKRTEKANAFSLNEPGAPARVGSTAEQLRLSLAGIVEWLAVDKKTNHRYQPREGLTFCNIYTHDYCFLAGVYLPRVWWTQAAVRDLAKGLAVEPIYEKTIEEQRANGLFRWLRDFGLEFGWRQTGTLTKLQTEVNQGAIGLIIARRKEDGKSGHVVAVVPETDSFIAKRNAAGEVIAPLQSQAGSVNFRYGTGKMDWWKGDQFAESAFWIHA